MPLVSVVIPTFGHRDYILAAVSSAMAQRNVDREIVVVNDGSPDDTANVVRPFVDAGAIRYIEQTNQGQAAARNRGVAEARGKYIAFLDDDDLWPADKLRWQSDLLESDRAIGAIGGSAVLIDNTGSEIGTSPVEDGWATVESLLRGNPFLSPGQTLIRADVLRQAGGLNARVWGADDYDLWFRLARASRIRTASRSALLYRKHASNASRNTGRLLLHTDLVIRSYLPLVSNERRFALQREVFRNLYWWLGQAFVREFRRSVGRRDLGAASRAADSLVPLARSILGDPLLTKQVLKDLVYGGMT